MHLLQETFATTAGEEEWNNALLALFADGDLDGAEAVLAPLLGALGTEMALLCEEASAEIQGWDVLAEAIRDFAGAPVTGMTLAIGNEADLAFEKGQPHRPYMMLGLYTDEAWQWSAATRAQVLAECGGECPAWAGGEEDIEVHLDLAGLDALNTALVHHKQRHLIREGAQTAVPLRYVDYVVGCWWRALLFHRAVAKACQAEALPGEVSILIGMVDMRPNALSLLLPTAREKPRKSRRRKAAVVVEDEAEEEEVFADMAARSLIQRGVIVEEKPVSGTDLRRRFAAQAPEPEEKKGLLARLFGR